MLRPRRRRRGSCFVRPAVTPLAQARPELLKLDGIRGLEVDARSFARAVGSVFAGGYDRRAELAVCSCRVRCSVPARAASFSRMANAPSAAASRGLG
jgi:hypothetical protein